MIKDEIYVISVVVPTHGRVELLKDLLESLQKAGSSCRVTLNVIIIDDSPLDQSEQIDQLCRIFQAQYIKGPSSVREKRNLGIEKSKGKFVFFVDSDCRVSENIFNEHLKMYDKPDTSGVLGVTEFVGKDTIMWRIVERTKFLDAFLFAKKLCNYVDSAPWGTCTNLSIRKDVLEAVGGFDTKFPFKLGGDDADLGIRINKAGYKIRMNPNALVYHSKETWNRFLAVAKRVFRWGRMDFHLFYEKHNDKISYTFPKPVTLFSFLFLPCFIKAIMNDMMMVLSIPFIWLFLFLLLDSLFIIRSSRDSLKDMPFEMSAQFLHFLFDLGTILESIKNKKKSAFFKSPLDDPRQVIILWDEKVREEWSIILTTIFTLFIFILV
jgi:GT2 family glycosyltransferase